MSAGGKKDLIARFGGIPLKRRQARPDHRPCPGPGIRTPQGADSTAPQAAVRAMRARHDGGSPQVAQLADLGKSGAGQPAWAALMAQDAAQNAYRLPRMP